MKKMGYAVIFSMWFSTSLHSATISPCSPTDFRWIPQKLVLEFGEYFLALSPVNASVFNSKKKDGQTCSLQLRGQIHRPMAVVDEHVVAFLTGIDPVFWIETVDIARCEVVAMSRPLLQPPTGDGNTMMVSGHRLPVPGCIARQVP